MNEMQLYSIRDTVTDKFGQPWTAQNDNAAKRAFERLAADKTTDISFRPKDFELYSIGHMNLETGVLFAAQYDITPNLSS